MMQRWWLVAEREIKTQLRSKAYQISFVVLLLVGFFGALVGGLLAKDSGPLGDGGVIARTEVAVVGELPEQAMAAGLRAVPVSSLEEAAAQVLDGSVTAAVVTDAVEGQLLLLAKDKVPDNVVEALTVSPVVQLLDPPRIDPLIHMIATLGCGILFFTVVMMFGQIAAQNTVVEKQTRVVEILLTAVPARSLMAGKVLGNAVLALAQVAGMLLALLLGLTATGWTGSLSLVSGSMVWFLVLFIVGFVLFSSLLAGSAALVSRIEDISAVIFPVLLLAMVPYMLVVYSSESQGLQRALSFVPFSSPMAMPARLLTGTVAWWEPLVALVILLVTTYGAIWLGGKLYENSLLRTGARVKWSEALRAKD